MNSTKFEARNSKSETNPKFEIFNVRNILPSNVGDGKDRSGHEGIIPVPIACCMSADNPAKPAINSAVTFLKKNGKHSLVSLGCGRQLNRIDNHLRLMKGLNLTYYVGIDCGPCIEPVSDNLFMDPDGMAALIDSNYTGQPRRFWDAVRLFPGTFVEELAGVHCAAVVCQRVYPQYCWEDSIISMNPKLVLQEDLHGCERQKLRGPQYVRNWSKIRQYGLRSFRPWPIFPGEMNLVLWRRRDFGGEKEKGEKFRWLQRLAESFIG